MSDSMKKWELPRRTFLRGAGTLLALPALEAMWPSMARAQGTRPARLLYFYVPCGIHMQTFTPTATGENYTLPATLASLANVKTDVNVLTGLVNNPARPDGAGDHASGTGAFLTCAHPFKTSGANIRNGVSVDQVAATALKGKTRFASLELGTSGGGATGDCDSGYSCAYARNIAWAGPVTPVAKETNPANVFNRLFSGLDQGQSAAAVAKRKLYRKSVLDFVRDDAEAIQRKVGSSDKQKLDEYMTGVREIETRIDGDPTVSCDPGNVPGTSADLRERTKTMIDLAVMAMQCDQTRVITFMLENAGSNFNFNFLGLSSGHHVYSHHQSAQANYAALQKIDAWEVSQYAYLLERMKTVSEPGGNMLDNSLVFLSSEISDGNRHNHNDMPVLLAGKGAGMVRTGRHLRFQPEKNVANLFLAMLRTVGVQDAAFGDSNGVLSEIFA